jgi:histidyl-tRNA synthetase
LDDLKKLGITNIEFDITVARGFDYYTDLVFEVFDTDPENNRSMFGGGRYDGLVGLFGVEPVPTVGFAMGDVTLRNFLETHRLLPELPVETDVFVLLAGDIFMEAQPIISGLRQNRLRVAVDSSGRKLPAQLKAASKRGVKYVVIIGDKELAEQKYVLKDMFAGTEETLTVTEIAAKVVGS